MYRATATRLHHHPVVPVLVRQHVQRETERKKSRTACSSAQQQQQWRMFTYANSQAKSDRLLMHTTAREEEEELVSSASHQLFISLSFFLSSLLLYTHRLLFIVRSFVRFGHRVVNFYFQNE